MYGALGVWSRPAADRIVSFEDDYASTYLPLVRQVPNVVSLDLFEAGTDGEDAELYRIGTMWFADETAYAEAATTPEWTAMFARCDELVEQYGLRLRYALVRKDG